MSKGFNDVRVAQHMALRYFHRDIPELSGNFLSKGQVQVSSVVTMTYSQMLDICLKAISLASRLGIKSGSESTLSSLPYADEDDKLVFRAPLLTALAQKEMLFLRGWKQFGSCVKGFNSLGLMAEQIHKELLRLGEMGVQQKSSLKRSYLQSRRSPGSNEPVFSEGEISGFSDEDFLELSDFDLSIWRCFGSTPIICSTSSNMGVSLHQALRLMQKANVEFKSRRFSLLNENEGELVIWCPDERADFMNMEKTALLRAIEAERPQITRLRTYINRQQRDPGALRDALLSGGYFFPTNPQSVEEMQNLIFFALKDLSIERGQSIEELVKDPLVRRTLDSVACEISKEGQVLVRSGVEGGIYGLMIPYFILLEEYLHFDFGKAISTWNQASIGAALAAAVLADNILRNFGTLSDDVRASFNSAFPALSQYLDNHQIGTHFSTQIHGVFDIANLQSLAQLLGVVVEDHMTGRGTAFVGLGSSSYSNGNRCYEILKNSFTGSGVFRGKEAFHAATHTINPFSQGLIFVEDLWRFVSTKGAVDFGSDSVVKEAINYVKKPEPAGAAALSGYLLKRLDSKTVSILEVAFLLKLGGFDKESFLEFSGYGANNEGLETFLQEASEEGPNMAGFAKGMLLLLDWNLDELRNWVASERQHSRAAYWRTTFDGFNFESLGNHTAIYLTGDNTGQPSEELYRNLLMKCFANRDAIQALIKNTNPGSPVRGKANLAFNVLNSINKYGNRVNKKVDRYSKRLMDALITKSLDS